MAVSWSPLNQSPENTANAMWLMQDGSVLVCLASDGATLKSLHPDSKGSYANGSWSEAGNFLLAKMNFASAVLPDGRLVACGGEQSGPGCPTTETNYCEIYDPLKKSSTEFPAPTGWGSIGDSPSVVLTDGTFMLGNTQGWGSQVALLDAATLTWTFGGGDSDNEQGYVLLQTGDVLTANVYNLTSMRYDPSVTKFAPDANLPVMLGAGSEIGPGMTLMDGRVIWFGASGHTCIYQPGAEGHDGKWIQGPDLPTMADGNQLVTNDSSAILEPNGKVFLVAWWGTKGVVVFLEYDPVRNQFNVIDGVPRTANREATKMLLLPSGHGLVSISKLAQNDDNGLYDVTFDSGAQASWAPTITSFPATVNSNSTVSLAGTQLCGLSECQHFGDDNQQAENYPMVRFVDSKGEVTYARAHDVSTRSIAPREPGTVLVDIPGSLMPGTYSLQVVAMGIPSPGIIVNVLAVLQLFYRGTDNSVWSRWRNTDGSWSNEQHIGGTLSGDPIAAQVPGTDVLQLFYRGTDKSVWSRWRNADGSWSNEQHIGGTLNGDPIAAQLPGTDVLQLFYRGTDNSVWSRWRNTDGSWSKEQHIGGTLNGDPIAAQIPGTDLLQLFYRGTDNNVYSRWRNTDLSWSAEQNFGGVLNGDPIAADVVAPTGIGGTLNGDPIAAQIPGTDLLQLFYRGTDNNVYSRWRNTDGSWSDEQHIGPASVC